MGPRRPRRGGAGGDRACLPEASGASAGLRAALVALGQGSRRGDPAGEAERCATLLIDDPTPSVVRSTLRTDPNTPSLRVVRQGGVGEVAGADVVLIEVDALSAHTMIVPSSRRGLLQAAVASETPVWVESGVGRLLPPKLWNALVSRVTEPGGHEEPGGRGGQVRQELGYFLESTDCAELVIGPDGATRSGEVRDDVAALDCPEPPELTASW